MTELTCDEIDAVEGGMAALLLLAVGAALLLYSGNAN